MDCAFAYVTVRAGVVSLESPSAPPLTCRQMTGAKKTHRQTGADGGRSTVPVTRETQVQARQHFTTPGTARIRKQTAAWGGEDVEKSELQCCRSVSSFIDAMAKQLCITRCDRHVSVLGVQEGDMTPIRHEMVITVSSVNTRLALRN